MPGVTVFTKDNRGACDAPRPATSHHRELEEWRRSLPTKATSQHLHPLRPAGNRAPTSAQRLCLGVKVPLMEQGGQQSACEPPGLLCKAGQEGWAHGARPLSPILWFNLSPRSSQPVRVSSWFLRAPRRHVSRSMCRAYCQSQQPSRSPPRPFPAGH